MEPIEIEYLPKTNDYMEADSLYGANTITIKLQKIIWLIGAIGCLIIILLYFNDIMLIIIGSFFVLTELLDFFGIFSFAKIFVKLTTKNNKKLKYIHKVKFIDEGIEFNTSETKSFIKWEFCKKYYEGNNIFMIVYNNRQQLFIYNIIFMLFHNNEQYVFFPKESFNDKIEIFRKILDEKIK